MVARLSKQRVEACSAQSWRPDTERLFKALRGWPTNSLIAEQHWPQTVVDSSGQVVRVATDALCWSLTCWSFPRPCLARPTQKIIGSPLSSLPSLLKKKCRGLSYTGDPSRKPQTADYQRYQLTNTGTSRNEPELTNCLSILTDFIARVANLTT